MKVWLAMTCSSVMKEKPVKGAHAREEAHTIAPALMTNATRVCVMKEVTPVNHKPPMKETVVMTRSSAMKEKPVRRELAREEALRTALPRPTSAIPVCAMKELTPVRRRRLMKDWAVMTAWVAPP
jgi:hypothetical protein